MTPPVRHLRKRLGLSRQEFSRLAGFSERSIASWEAGARMSARGRQRMQEMQALHQALAAQTEPEAIGPWLLAPNEAFGGLKPLEVVERGELHRLWQMLFWLESAAPS